MKTSYTVDQDHRIICVGGSWDDFAAQNDGANAMAEQVIGHSLWKFTDGFEVQSFLNAIIFSVRQKNQVFTTLYRCDGPNTPRLFRMTATPLSQGHVQVDHALLETPQFPFSPSVVALVRNVCNNRCSMCCSFKVGEDWIDPFAHPETRFFPDSHVVCPACKGLAREGFGQVVEMQRQRT